MGIFYIHLTILNQTGPGDGFYSSAYQISLKGLFHNNSIIIILLQKTERNNLKLILTYCMILIIGNYLHSASTPKEVAYGAILSLKNGIYY